MSDRCSPNLSYVEGPTDVPLIEHTIGKALDRARTAWRDNPAVVSRHQGIRWTWGELADEVDSVACGLLSLGVTSGDRVGIWAPNCAEWLTLQLATARIGAILVNINPAYRVAELEYALNKVGCSVLVVAPSFKTSDYLGMVRALLPTCLPLLRTCVSLGAEKHDGFLPWAALRLPVAPHRLARVEERLKPTDPINIQFTSGTTGSPKGATLSHRNILNNGYFVGRQIGMSPNDKICIPVPLYHCFGMVMGNLACLTHGAAIVYPGESFDPLSVLRSVEAERCSALYGVPTMFIAILNHPDFDRFDLSSLRTGIMAGSPCPETIMQRVIAHMHMSEVSIAYGMTETSPVSSQTDRDDGMEERVTTVGRIHPHLEMKVVDSHGAVLPRGLPGELCTRGYSVMHGYWDDPVRTAEAIDQDGWMHTGDVGTLDSSGYCRITGRLKDMLIRGGENIYPREIEEFLTRHPAIADVQVVGVADEKYGEAVCACVIKKDGSDVLPEDIRTYCLGQIAHYKVPRHVLFFDSFPMTITGKVQKYALCEQAEAQLRSKGISGS